MKKKRRIVRGIKSYFKPFVNVRGWMGLDQIAETSRHIGSQVKAVFKPQQSERGPETFDEAIQRLQLSEADIYERQRAFKRLAMIFVTVMLVALGYALYLLFSGKFLGGIVAVGVTAICLGMAFKYHFWYFQVKKRKLGCSFKEWLDEGLFR